MKIPTVLEHNYAKYQAIKKAFYLTALENVEGDYCEFGVFTGGSFVCAMRAYDKSIPISPTPITFYGFDSFQGFGEVNAEDSHHFFVDNTFSVQGSKVIRYIKKKSGNRKVILVPGFFESTLKEKSCTSINIKKIRVVFIDCDMKQPARLALQYIKQGLQQGTIIILDDFFAYHGDKSKGVAGAFFDFCKKNKEFEFRRVFEYGYGSVAYIVSKVPQQHKT